MPELRHAPPYRADAEQRPGSVDQIARGYSHQAGATAECGAIHPAMTFASRNRWFNTPAVMTRLMLMNITRASSAITTTTTVIRSAVVGHVMNSTRLELLFLPAFSNQAAVSTTTRLLLPLTDDER